MILIQEIDECFSGKGNQLVFLTSLDSLDFKVFSKAVPQDPGVIKMQQPLIQTTFPETYALTQTTHSKENANCTCTYINAAVQELSGYSRCQLGWLSQLQHATLPAQHDKVNTENQLVIAGYLTTATKEKQHPLRNTSHGKTDLLVKGFHYHPPGELFAQSFQQQLLEYCTHPPKPGHTHQQTSAAAS